MSLTDKMQTVKILSYLELGGRAAQHLCEPGGEWLRFLRVGALCLASCSAVSDATAQPWQRLPDGRSVIEIKDHKLAFDPNIWGAAGTSATVNFLSDHESERHSLAEVLAEPDRFRVVFSNSPEVLVRMSNSFNGPGLFLNRFDRRSVPDSTGIELDIFDADLSTSGHCDPRYFFRRFTPQNAFCTERDLGPFETETPDADGFLRRASPTPFARAQRAEYVLAGESQKTYAPLVVTCLPALNDAQPREWGQCSASSSYGSGVGIYYQFQYVRFPKSKWVALDHRMREIYADILMQNEGGQK